MMAFGMMLMPQPFGRYLRYPCNASARSSRAGCRARRRSASAPSARDDGGRVLVSSGRRSRGGWTACAVSTLSYAGRRRRRPDASRRRDASPAGLLFLWGSYSSWGELSNPIGNHVKPIRELFLCVALSFFLIFAGMTDCYCYFSALAKVRRSSSCRTFASHFAAESATR